MSPWVSFTTDPLAHDFRDSLKAIGVRRVCRITSLAGFDSPMDAVQEHGT
jgi:hypothetical protein